jgi:hypothetical protein
MPDKWRVGRHISLNVYEGDRPICQCHTAMDARRIVEAVNGCGVYYRMSRKAAAQFGLDLGFFHPGHVVRGHEVRAKRPHKKS